MKESSPPSQKGSSSSLLGELPLLSPKTSSSASLLGELPLGAKKPSLPPLSPKGSKSSLQQEEMMILMTMRTSLKNASKKNYFQTSKKRRKNLYQKTIQLWMKSSSQLLLTSTEQSKPLAMVHDNDNKQKNSSAELKTSNGVNESNWRYQLTTIKYEMNQNGKSSQESMNLLKNKICFKAIRAEYR